MTTNEAAERLDSLINRWTAFAVRNSVREAAKEALAAERRATVERMRALLGLPHTDEHGWDSGPLCQGCTGDWLEEEFEKVASGAILDEVAARDTQLSQPDGKVRP